MEESKGVVCVTGGTGYIASWLIMRLLQRGYTVRATTRLDSERKRDISYLTNLPGASDRLQIFHADLEQPGSFGEAIEGCIGVFHVAHPINIENEPEEISIKRAVEGTLGILKACVDSKTVKRVVYTSTIAAVMLNGNNQTIADENSWTDVDYYRSLRAGSTSYVVAKTMAEMAAVEFAEKSGLDLVTVNPSLVAGPFICPAIPGTVRLALAMILGERSQYPYLVDSRMVHIEDVVSAHIFLFENPNIAKGRYICSSIKLLLDEMVDYLARKYPEFQIPTIESLQDIPRFKLSNLSSQKLLDSGFQYKYSLDDIFDGAIGSCKEKGFL